MTLTVGFPLANFLTDDSYFEFLTETPKTISVPEGEYRNMERAQDQLYNNTIVAPSAPEEIYTRVLPPVGKPLDLFDSYLEEGKDLEEISNLITKQEEVRKALTDLENFSSVDAALAADPQVAAELFRQQRRADNVRLKLMDMIERNSAGGVDGVFEVIDQLVYDTVAGIRDIKQGFTGGGTEVTTLSEMWSNAIRELDDEEFKAFVEERFKDMSWQAETFISSDMAWNYYRELVALNGAGYVLWDKEMGYVSSIFAAMDVITLGLGGVEGIGKAGRSIIGRLRSKAGTEVATEAATGTDLIVKGGLDGEILEPQLRLGGPGVTAKLKPKQQGFKLRPDVEDAIIIEDIAPGSYATSIKPSPRKSPPVSQAAIGKAWSENRWIKPFVARANRMGFGTADFSTKATDWAKSMAKSMADASATRVIDSSIGVSKEGIENYTAEFLLGKLGGKGFKSVESAEKIIASMDSSSAVLDVINLRTLKPLKPNETTGSFAIRVRARVPTRELVDPINVNELKAPLLNLLGRSGRGSGTITNNLADAGDFTSAAFRKDIEKNIKKLRRDLKGEYDNINTILTNLRDTPNMGNARTWLRPDKFSQEYKTLTGKWPNKKVMKAYESLVEMSDFSYFVMAQERLRGLANQGAMVFRASDDSVDVLVFPSDKTIKEIKSKTKFLTWVWDAGAGQRKALKSIPDDLPVMRFNTKQKDGSEYLVNYHGKLRLPEMEDAYPYNAGGPRSNPDIKYFIGNADGMWNTLLGARSERDASIAVKEYNVVANKLNNMGLDLDDIKLTSAQRKELDDLVKTNNTWNPDIENIEEFLEFAKTRGIKPNQSVEYRARGTKVNEFETLNIADKQLLDISLEKFMVYHRQDHALVEFGGELSNNPDPILAVSSQFNRLSDKAAKTQYMMEHPTAWVKAVERASKNGKDVHITNATGPMTDAMMVKNWVITGNGQAARALRNEQRIIKRRLDLYGDESNGFRRTINDATSKTIEALHNTHPTMGAIGAAVDKKVREAPQMLLSLGFMQRMAEPSQVFLQSAHIIPMSAISPKNGPRAVMLASYIRQAARTGDSSLWNVISKRLSKFTGLSDEEFKTLSDHLFDSGRGYMRGAIAEDPNAVGVLRGPLKVVGDFARIPYYAGENFSATVSRITAFLDVRNKYPKIDPNSKQFWNLVQQRDRDLSFALNSAQKSAAQSNPITAVATQWTSYQLRALETIVYGGENLSKAERARLAAASTILWGIGGMGIASLLPDVTKEEQSFIKDVIINGIDVAFDAGLGIKVGNRVAFNPIELIERAQGTLIDTFNTIPAFSIASDTAGSALSALSNFASGRYAASSHELKRLVRAWKIIDSPIMAYTMMMEDVRRSRSGSEIPGPFTTSQELFQALGISPSQVVDIGRASDIAYSMTSRKNKAIEKALPIFKAGLAEAEAGNYEGATNLFLDADAIISGFGLSDTYLAEARAAIFNKSQYDRLLTIYLNLIKQNQLEMAKEMEGIINGR